LYQGTASAVPEIESSTILGFSLQDSAGAEAQISIARCSARLNRPPKKSKQQIPRGLKAARDDKNKGLFGTTEVVP